MSRVDEVADNKKLGFKNVLGSMTLEQLDSQSIPLDGIEIDDINVGDVLFLKQNAKMDEDFFIYFGHIIPNKSGSQSRIHYDLYEVLYSTVGLTKPLAENIDVRQFGYNYTLDGIKDELNWRLWQPSIILMASFINWPNENPFAVK